MSSIIRKIPKIAIIHDILLDSGGAERVLDCILELYPRADLYTSLASPSHQKKYKKHHRVFSMKPNLWRLGPQLSSVLKPYILLYWKSLKLDGYDLIISSSHSFSSKSIQVNNTVPHVSYIHTPPKYLFAEFNEMNWIKKFPFKLIFLPLIALLKLQDVKSAQKPTALIANSHVVQHRIKRYYKRNSEVIYPPVLGKWKIKRNQSKDYFLFHSRLVHQKGLELAVRTCNKLGEQLVIVGEGPELKRVKKIAKSNCLFLGKVPDLQLTSIYSKTKALIFCGIDEDFGLVMAEALSAGVPILGFKTPATKEIVSNPQLGILFDDFSVRSLSLAIERFKKNQYSWQFCSNYAKKYSKEKFKANFAKLMLSYLPQ